MKKDVNKTFFISTPYPQPSEINFRFKKSYSRKSHNKKSYRRKSHINEQLSSILIIFEYKINPL